MARNRGTFTAKERVGVIVERVAGEVVGVLIGDSIREAADRDNMEPLEIGDVITVESDGGFAAGTDLTIAGFVIKVSGDLD